MKNERLWVSQSWVRAGRAGDWLFLETERTGYERKMLCSNLRLYHLLAVENAALKCACGNVRVFPIHHLEMTNFD